MAPPHSAATRRDRSRVAAEPPGAAVVEVASPAEARVRGSLATTAQGSPATLPQAAGGSSRAAGSPAATGRGWTMGRHRSAAPVQARRRVSAKAASQAGARATPAGAWGQPPGGWPGDAQELEPYGRRNGQGQGGDSAATAAPPHPVRYGCWALPRAAGEPGDGGVPAEAAESPAAVESKHREPDRPAWSPRRKEPKGWRSEPCSSLRWPEPAGDAPGR